MGFNNMSLHNEKIVLAVDLINTDFRSFIALPYIGGITIRKAKVDIRSALLKYFVDSTFLKNQTKDLYIRRSLYAQKNSTAKPPSDNCNSKEN